MHQWINGLIGQWVYKRYGTVDNGAVIKLLCTGDPYYVLYTALLIS
jgi:hypothetical protein